LLPTDYLFHHYSGSEIFLNNPLPQVIYLEFDHQKGTTLVKKLFEIPLLIFGD